MNYIDINSNKIIDAKAIHEREIIYFICKKLGIEHGYAENELITKTDFKAKYYKKEENISALNNIKNYLNTKENVIEIISAEVDNLKSKEQQLLRAVIPNFDLSVAEGYYNDTIKDKKNHAYHPYFKVINDIFDYNTWKDKDKKRYDAYDLAQNLNIPTCPYCGRMYTKTVVSEDNKKITRPQFDHWFAKSRYPLLALSFFNLVPSCNICNSGLKGNKDYQLDEVFHPYYKDENQPLNIKFTYKLDSYNLPSIKIKHADADSYSKNSIEAFELEEIYTAHQDELKDLIQIRNHYSDTYLEQLRKMSGIELSTKELYRLAFGTYMEEAEFDRRPLSRMKKDILIELGIIKPE